MAGYRLTLLVALAAALGGARLQAQCPTGTPPPCGPPAGVAQLRVISANPMPGTSLSMDTLRSGVPVHVVIEQSLERLPRGLTATVYLMAVRKAPTASSRAGEWWVVSSRAASTQRMQFAIEGVLCPKHVLNGAITLQVTVMFADSRGTGEIPSRSSMLLEYPVVGIAPDPAAPGAAQRPAAPGVCSASRERPGR